MISYYTFKKYSIWLFVTLFAGMSWWCANRVGPALDGSFVEMWYGIAVVISVLFTIAMVIIGLIKIYE